MPKPGATGQNGAVDAWDRMIDGLRAGDAAILSDFVRRYGPALEKIAARNIGPGMRRRVGPESIALSVCRTFLRRAGDDQFTLADGDSLWRLLCAITLNKVREKTRYHLRQKRGVDREAHLESLDAREVFSDPTPTPEEAAIFTDAFEHVIASLAEEERRILELRLQEQTHEQIAEEMGCSERTVRRMLKGLEVRLTAALGD